MQMETAEVQKGLEILQEIQNIVWPAADLNVISRRRWSILNEPYKTRRRRARVGVTCRESSLSKFAFIIDIKK